MDIAFCTKAFLADHQSVEANAAFVVFNLHVLADPFFKEQAAPDSEGRRLLS